MVVSSLMSNVINRLFYFGLKMNTALYIPRYHRILLPAVRCPFIATGYIWNYFPLMWLVRSELHASLGEGRDIGKLVLQSQRLKVRVPALVSLCYNHSR